MSSFCFFCSTNWNSEMPNSVNKNGKQFFDTIPAWIPQTIPQKYSFAVAIPEVQNAFGFFVRNVNSVIRYSMSKFSIAFIFIFFRLFESIAFFVCSTYELTTLANELKKKQEMRLQSVMWSTKIHPKHHEKISRFHESANFPRSERRPKSTWFRMIVRRGATD